MKNNWARGSHQQISPRNWNNC